MKERKNPFAPENLGTIPFHFPPGDGWEALLVRLAANNWRGSIVGPRGSGKTTLLEQMAPYLEKRGFVPRLFTLGNETTIRDKRNLLEEIRPMRAPDFLLLDGAEQLITREWLTLHAAAHLTAGAVLTLHRVGRLPVILETTPNLSLLEKIIGEVSGARLPAGEAASLFQRHRGDLRLCLQELHERWLG